MPPPGKPTHAVSATIRGDNPLADATGKDGKPAHIGYDGNLYDVTNSKLRKNGAHMGRHFAGEDLTEEEADTLFSEAIEIVAGLYREGIIPKRDDYPAYPDLSTFYDTNTKIEQILYEMFMDHRMKTFQGAFHMNYDYSTYGYAKMRKDLTEIRELAQEIRHKTLK